MTRIVETADGYEFTLDGKRHGTWRSRAEASGGLKVELLRKERPEAEDEARQIAFLKASADLRSAISNPIDS